MEVITRKLHEAVNEIEPTEAEWFEAIMFLTRTGQTCTDWRQEFILLSDVLSVSMLVDTITYRKPSGSSDSTVLGPFHVADAPELPMGAEICLDTYGNSIAGAKIDVWQANDEGFYDVQQKGLQPDFNLRGVFRTGSDGAYHFRGVKPKIYRSRMMVRRANCRRRLVATPTDRHICITSSKPKGSAVWSRIFSIRMTPTSGPMRCLASRKA